MSGLGRADFLEWVRAGWERIRPVLRKIFDRSDMSDSRKDAVGSGSSRDLEGGEEPGTGSSAGAPAAEVEGELPEEGSVGSNPGEAAAEEEGEVGAEDRVERLQEELDRLNDRHLRLAAEFDNFRRRSHSEMGQSGVRAKAELVGDLLDILDDFERVTSLDPEQATVESVLEGVRLVERKLNRVLEEAGLETIEAEDGAFDPNSMEAVMKEPAESEKEDETVARVFQKGFRFKGQLVRPARVSVRKHE